MTGSLTRSDIYDVKNLEISVDYAYEFNSGITYLDAHIVSLSSAFNSKEVTDILKPGRAINIRTFRPKSEFNSGSFTFDNLKLSEYSYQPELRAYETIDACDINSSKAFKDYQDAVMQRHFGNDADLPCSKCTCKKEASLDRNVWEHRPVDF
jgi:hypothetical protein